MAEPVKQQGVVVQVSPWRIFLQAWFQKLLATAISAKVLIALLVVWLSYSLTMTFRMVDKVVDGKVLSLKEPILDGASWAALMGTVITIFIGARVAPTMIDAVGGIVAAWKNGKKCPPSPDDDAMPSVTLPPDELADGEVDK